MMTKLNSVTIRLSEERLAVATKKASAADLSVAEWIINRIPEFAPWALLGAARFCADYRAAHEIAKSLAKSGAQRIQSYIDLLDLPEFPELRMQLLLEGRSGQVFEILTRDMGPLPEALSWTEESRFVVGGSPWPYRVLDDYSQTVVRERRTVLLLKNCHGESAFLDDGERPVGHGWSAEP